MAYKITRPLDFTKFIDGVDDTEANIIINLREIILTHFDWLEGAAYKVPYYYGHRRVCFIWPASIPAGPKTGVILGFCYGNLMDDPRNILIKIDCKQVHWLKFYDVHEIDPDVVIEYLCHAQAVDETFRKI